MGMKLLYLSLGGAAGTLSRYWLSGLAQRLAGTAFPLGTFMVNMLGCLFFGAVWGYFENRLLPGSGLRILALTGFMGAFTTFSTLMFETAMLLQDSEWLLAAANLGVQNFIGLLAIFLGLFAGRLV